MTASLANRFANTGEASGDVYIDIRGLQGSNYGDVLVADATANGNALSGLGGNDTLVGGAGADTLDGGDGFDTVSYWNAAAGVRASLFYTGYNSGEARGDSYSSIEALVGSVYGDMLQGNGVANALSGGSGNDELLGGAGNDTLDGAWDHDTLVGGEGADVLTGGAGRDVFRFEAGLGAGQVDTLTDFSAAEGDRIELETHLFRAFPDVVLYETDAGLTYLNSVLKAAQFTIGAAATTTAQRIVYNSATGALFYDADGSGSQAQVQFAQLKAGLALSAANFGLYTL